LAGLGAYGRALTPRTFRRRIDIDGLAEHMIEQRDFRCYEEVPAGFAEQLVDRTVVDRSVSEGPKGIVDAGVVTSRRVGPGLQQIFKSGRVRIDPGRAADEQIVVVATAERVGTGSANQDVTTGIAPEGVVFDVADEEVVARTPRRVLDASEPID